MIGRRAFLVGTGAGLLAAPLAAEAQQAEKVFKIGFLTLGSSASPLLDAFYQGGSSGIRVGEN
ncbi:MAG TPA: hypothetical protein VE482_04370, partial [Candidatus Eisenbacteria bacterium]|nr:hypothetical protein [Candidatus Eisenbacteria bacterium]